MKASSNKDQQASVSAMYMKLNRTIDSIEKMKQSQQKIEIRNNKDIEDVFFSQILKPLSILHGFSREDIEQLSNLEIDYTKRPEFQWSFIKNQLQKIRNGK